MSARPEPPRPPPGGWYRWVPVILLALTAGLLVVLVIVGLAIVQGR